jgi:cysteinyl-tRNA synthetase
MLRLYNTLTRKKEDFQTLEPDIVKLYVCGVTVYNDAHVGHAMSALVFDIIRRYLEYRGYKVRHVMNYTDVDDKIINRAQQLGEEPLKLSQRYIEDYNNDLKNLNILPATSNPQVSKTMPLIIQFIGNLIEKGFAYAAQNGDVYFRVTRDEDYGKLSGRKIDDMQAGARVEVDEAKEHPMDFALWKAAKPGEIFWESPWGKGRPGWHIECSAMNLAELGEQIDIHGGGNDLIFPHHENEIAQTESLTGKTFARYWLHNGMLQIQMRAEDGSFKLEKMSKSLGNVVTIKEFLSKHEPDVLRLVVLSSYYRSPLAYGEAIVADQERKLARLRSALEPAVGAAESGAAVESLAAVVANTRERFVEALDDDFNTSGALAALFELVRSINTARDAGVGGAPFAAAQAALHDLTGVLGLTLERQRQDSQEAAPFIDLLVELRAELRKAKQFALADMVRARLGELGVTLEDGPQGTRWKTTA